MNLRQMRIKLNFHHMSSIGLMLKPHSFVSLIRMTTT